MRIAVLAPARLKLVILLSAIALLGMGAPSTARALTMQIEPVPSKVFVAGQIGKYQAFDSWDLDVVGPDYVFSDIFIPDVSANLGFGEFYRFIILETVLAPITGLHDPLTTNTFDVELQFWDPGTDPNNPIATTTFEIFLTTLAIPTVSCGMGSDQGSFGEPLAATGEIRLEGIACVPSLPGVFNDQFVNIEVAGTVLLPTLPGPARLGLLALLTLALTRRTRWWS